MVQLRGGKKAYATCLDAITYKPFLKGKRTYWHYDSSSGLVRAQSVCWLYCWAMTGMGVESVRAEAERLFDTIFQDIGFEGFDRLIDHDWARKARRIKRDIESDLDDILHPEDFDKRVARSKNLSQKERLERLKRARKNAVHTTRTQKSYTRNPDVVAEALYRAGGVCQSCGSTAPFRRKSNGDPYLEVHHVKSLSDKGEDTIGNVIALCPNCHREVHFGIK